VNEQLALPDNKMYKRVINLQSSKMNKLKGFIKSLFIITIRAKRKRFDIPKKGSSEESEQPNIITLFD
jgi:hypothetical protein